jgi:hypothetical protein
MAFLRNNMTTLEILEGVTGFLPPTPEEVRRCDQLEKNVRFEEGKDPRGLLPELFFLKVSVALEYAVGMLQQLGMSPEGVAQFHEFYTNRLSQGMTGAIQSVPGHGVALLKSRMQSYARALHEKHPEDPHLNVADRFTRYAGCADEPQLTALCLDTCKLLNRAFLDEIASLSRPQ